jgi:geranylgeranyl pyrophosphate synthase
LKYAVDSFRLILTVSRFLAKAGTLWRFQRRQVILLMMNDLEKFFAECAAAVDAELETLLPSAETAPQKLHEAMRWSVFAGGKRFRPALVLAVGQMFGASHEKLLKTAAAIELIHTYSLIHDDLPAMDDDDLRRGRLTCHKKYDEATAILAGDILQTLAFQSLAEDENLSDETRVKLIIELARSAAKMVDGQQLDLEAEGKPISVADLETIHRNKTGAMISVSARSGAIIAGANAAESEAMMNYAENLGLLFQITDDVLDATQTSETLGKTAGKDAKAEKATYVSLYGLDEANNLAKKIADEATLNLNKINRETELLRALVEFILNRTS